MPWVFSGPVVAERGAECLGGVPGPFFDWSLLSRHWFFAKRLSKHRLTEDRPTHSSPQFSGQGGPFFQPTGRKNAQAARPVRTCGTYYLISNYLYVVFPFVRLFWLTNIPVCPVWCVPVCPGKTPQNHRLLWKTSGRGAERPQEPRTCAGRQGNRHPEVERPSLGNLAARHGPLFDEPKL